MIIEESRGPVSVLRIDRHTQRNALNLEVIDGIVAGLENARKAGARAVVLTGEGSAFCAGADLDVVRSETFIDRMYVMIHGIAELPIPVIAAINGPAIGAGAQLAIACDLRVAAPSVRFAIPTIRLGLAVDQWTIRRLSSLAGGGPARALLLGGDTVDVERAYGLGLVDRLGTLEDAFTWADEIAGLAPLSLAYNKQALNAVTDGVGDDDAVEKGFDAVWASEDSHEGLRARAERRPPRFEGR